MAGTFSQRIVCTYLFTVNMTAAFFRLGEAQRSAYKRTEASEGETLVNHLGFKTTEDKKLQPSRSSIKNQQDYYVSHCAVNVSVSFWLEAVWDNINETQGMADFSSRSPQAIRINEATANLVCQYLRLHAVVEKQRIQRAHLDSLSLLSCGKIFAWLKLFPECTEMF